VAGVDVVVAVVVSGLMWFASSGIYHVWPLAWLAPVPLLIVLPELGPGRAALAAFVAAAGGAAGFVVAYWSALPPGMLALLLVAVPAPWTVVAVVWRVIARRTGPVVTALAWAALVPLAEYLVARVSPNGTFGSLAYTQASVLAIIQLAAVTGIRGISFVVSLGSATLAVMWRSRDSRSAREAAFGVAALVVAATLVYGDLRLAAPSPSAIVRVGLAAADTTNRPFAENARDALRVARGYAARVAALAPRGLQYVVLPEKFVAVRPPDDYGVRVVLAGVARRYRVTVVAGLNAIGQTPPHNFATVFGPDGLTVLDYDKVHLVPGLEDGYHKGGTPGLLPDTAVAAGVAICKDLDFVPTGLAYARAGVGLVLVPAWDFGADGWLHSRMAVLRGVEGGYAVARAATDGLLTVSDARGRIVAERSSRDASEVLVSAGVRVAPGGTIYSRSGDWFAALCLLVVVLAALAARRRGVAEGDAAGGSAGQRTTQDRQRLPR